jgi:hypothetical protein
MKELSIDEIMHLRSTDHITTNEAIEMMAKYNQMNQIDQDEANGR